MNSDQLHQSQTTGQEATPEEAPARAFDPEAAVRGLQQVVGDQIADDALRLAELDRSFEYIEDEDDWIHHAFNAMDPDDYAGIVPEPFPILNPVETVATATAIMRTGSAEQPGRALANLAEYRDRCRDLADTDDPLAADRLKPPLNNMRALIEEHAIDAGLVDQDHMEYGNAPYSERLEHFRAAAEQIRIRADQTPKPDELTEQEAVNLAAAACETRESEDQQHAQSLLDRYDTARNNDDRTASAGVVEELRQLARGHLRRRLELTAKTAAVDLNIHIGRKRYAADQAARAADHTPTAELAPTHQTNPNAQDSSHEW